MSSSRRADRALPTRQRITAASARKQLQHYESLLLRMIGGSMSGAGFGLRDAGGTAVEQPAIILWVTECEPELLQSIASIVPPDAVQGWIMPEMSLT